MASIILLLLSIASGFNEDARASTSTCDEMAKKLYTPQDAIKDIKSGKLVFMGRDTFPKHALNKSCVYKSDRAYIIYNNCLSSKKESAQSTIDVISFDGDIVSFNIFNSGKIENQQYSMLSRSEYDFTWTVSSTKSSKPGNLNVNQLKTYIKNSEYNKFCTIGSMGKAQDMSSKVYCEKGISDASWMAAGESFWKNPGSEWQQTLQYLKNAVLNSNF